MSNEVQVTGKVLVGLSSPAITVLSGSASRSKHMGYMRINIAHAPVEWFQHVFPSFRVIVKKKLKIGRLGLTSARFSNTACDTSGADQ